MIDLITVVFKDELLIIQAQAQSIAKYCKQLNIGTIYVVVNDTADVVDMINRNWWGDLSDHVIVVSRSMFSTNWTDNGWVSQQALKLLAAAVSYNKYSMILDAKTIFVRELTLDQLFNSDEQIQTGQLDVYPVFEPSRQIVNQLFDIDLTQQVGPGGVPFVVHNHMVRSLIAEAFDRTQQSFPDWFQSQGMLTEFLLYSGYIVKCNGTLDVLYSKNNQLGSIVNVCHSEVAAWDRKFAEMQQSNTLTVSVHRRAWTELTVEQKQQYQTFLLDHGVTLV